MGRLYLAASGAGFTLIELVVVIAIITTLFGVLLTAFDPARQLNRTKDAQREHDLSVIRTALDTYFHDNNCYPLNLSDLATTYIRSIPKDPTTKLDYAYQKDPSSATCPAWIVLYAKLSSSSSICQLASTCRPSNFSSGNFACVPLGSVNCSSINTYTIP